MNDFKDEYRNLKDSINSDNSKIVSFLVFGVLLGRLIEKFYNLKKTKKKKMNRTMQKFVAIAIAAGVLLSTISYFLLLL